jgi:hypothetical protein
LFTLVFGLVSLLFHWMMTPSVSPKKVVFVTDEPQVHSLSLMVLKMWAGMRVFLFLLCKIFPNVIYDRLHIVWASFHLTMPN